jgi:cellulose synthase/poly-beta-1,6-N-acetylglucosamine synthase-like glycosyltransferase
MISGFFVLLGLVYLLAAMIVLIGLYRKWPESVGEPLKSASVIICARDEETDLPACLASLEAQELDSGTSPLEVILVDDASRDRTGELMEAYARTSRHKVQVQHLEAPGLGELSGKWRPLKEGLRRAHNEGLLMTDADAVLPPGWVQGHLWELASAEMTAGFARLEGRGIWGLVQSLDWLFLVGAGSAMTRLGRPQSALGKNLSVRRTDYLASGGLEKMGFSLTEDLALVQHLVRRGGRMRFPLDRNLMVSTPAAPNWTEFSRQRRRWAAGRKHLRSSGMALLTIAGLRNFAVVLGVLSGQPLAFLLWGITACFNLLIQARLTSVLGLKSRLLYFPLWEVFYTWSTPILVVAYLFNPRVGWKGRKFTSSRKPLPSS